LRNDLDAMNAAQIFDVASDYRAESPGAIASTHATAPLQPPPPPPPWT